MGGSEISRGDQDFLVFCEVLSEIHPRLLQDCGTPHSSDEEGGGFLMGS